MAYIRRFDQLFKKEQQKEDTTAFHGSREEIREFTEKQIQMNKGQELPGMFFTSNDNDARLIGGPFVTEVRLKLVNVLATSGNSRIKRPDVLYMINKSPDIDEALARFHENPREAQFKAIDFVMKAMSVSDGFARIYEEFYKGHNKEFVKNMSNLGYDGMVIKKKDDVKHYIVFNSKAIKIKKKG